MLRLRCKLFSIYIVLLLVSRSRHSFAFFFPQTSFKTFVPEISGVSRDVFLALHLVPNKFRHNKRYRGMVFDRKRAKIANLNRFCALTLRLNSIHLILPPTQHPIVRLFSYSPLPPLRIWNFTNAERSIRIRSYLPYSRIDALVFHIWQTSTKCAKNDTSFPAPNAKNFFARRHFFTNILPVRCGVGHNDVPRYKNKRLVKLTLVKKSQIRVHRVKNSTTI